MEDASDTSSRPTLSLSEWPELPASRASSSPASQRLPTPPSFWSQTSSSSEDSFSHTPDSISPAAATPVTPSSDSRAASPHEAPYIHIHTPSSEPNDPESTDAADVVEESEPVEPADMATSLGSSPGDPRRGVISPRPKGRENAKNTLCRNIGIYGHCRYENEGCAFNHDANSLKSNQTQTQENRRLNVDSPSFKPLSATPNGLQNARSTTISPKSANAAPFTPKTNTPSPYSRPRSTSAPISQPNFQSHMQPATLQPPSSQPNWAPQNFQEFVPTNYDASSIAQQADPHAAANMLSSYDPFSLASTVQGLANTHQQPQLNPYAQDPTTLAGAAYFGNAGGFAQPAQYHNYAPMGPHRENVLAYQRTTHDFFIPDKLREDLQRKAEASLQVLPNSTLPANVDHFHSLVPLDTNNQRNATTFGYVSWLYKATSSKDGKLYTLRRLEGFRLTNEEAMRASRAWRRVDNGSVVNIHETFTTRDFGDSSLIFVTDYHPNSKTLAETHLQQNPNPRYQGRQPVAHVPESVLWGYVVQIASALKAIHSNGLAAQTIIPNKILVTSKNRIRLNGCGILDVVRFDSSVPVQDLQQEDFAQLGRLILSIASNANAALNISKAIDHLTRTYTPKLKACVDWLLQPQVDPESGQTILKDIEYFLQNIASEVIQTYDSQLHADDALSSTLMGELENGRLVRLMAKLGLINERPEYEHNPQWSETGERYYLKLFRDYVFHAVDSDGRPVTDLGHIINCLNKLDAGSTEMISLVSRDEQTSLVVSYKELKKGIETAFNELSRSGRRN